MKMTEIEQGMILYHTTRRDWQTEPWAGMRVRIISDFGKWILDKTTMRYVDGSDVLHAKRGYLIEVLEENRDQVKYVTFAALSNLKGPWEDVRAEVLYNQAEKIKRDAVSASELNARLEHQERLLQRALDELNLRTQTNIRAADSRHILLSNDIFEQIMLALIDAGWIFRPWGDGSE